MAFSQAILVLYNDRHKKIQRAVSEITKMSTSSYLDCPLANNSFKISYNNQFQNSKKRHSKARDFQKIKKKKE
jgi:hypothetical protein